MKCIKFKNIIAGITFLGLLSTDVGAQSLTVGLQKMALKTHVKIQNDFALSYQAQSGQGGVQRVTSHRRFQDYSPDMIISDQMSGIEYNTWPFETTLGTDHGTLNLAFAMDVDPRTNPIEKVVLQKKSLSSGIFYAYNPPNLTLSTGSCTKWGEIDLYSGAFSCVFLEEAMQRIAYGSYGETILRAGDYKLLVQYRDFPEPLELSFKVGTPNW